MSGIVNPSLDITLYELMPKYDTITKNNFYLAANNHDLINPDKLGNIEFKFTNNKYESMDP